MGSLLAFRKVTIKAPWSTQRGLRRYPDPGTLHQLGKSQKMNYE